MTQPTDSSPDSVVPASPATRRRTRLVIALLAAVVLLGGAGAAAAWALTEGDPAAGDQVQARPGTSASPGATADPTGPSSDPSASITDPSAGADPDAEVMGRNVFAPLVDTVAVEGVPGDGDLPGSVEVTAAGPTLAGPTLTPDPGVITVPGDPVIVTRTQAGPTQTVPGPPVPGPTVPGPTTTVTAPPSTVTATTGFTHVVTVAGVADPAADDSPATFTVNGTSSTVAVDAAFGSVFTYIDYDAASGLVSFGYGTTVVRSAAGRTHGLH